MRRWGLLVTFLGAWLLGTTTLAASSAVAETARPAGVAAARARLPVVVNPLGLGANQTANSGCIHLTSPRVGQAHYGLILVSGEARLPEGALTVELRDAGDGRLLARERGVTGHGGGSWGDFASLLEYAPAQAHGQPARVLAFGTDMRSGQPLCATEVRVVLYPGG